MQDISETSLPKIVTNLPLGYLIKTFRHHLFVRAIVSDQVVCHDCRGHDGDGETSIPHYVLVLGFWP